MPGSIPLPHCWLALDALHSQRVLQLHTTDEGEISNALLACSISHLQLLCGLLRRGCRGGQRFPLCCVTLRYRRLQRHADLRQPLVTLLQLRMQVLPLLHLQ